MPTSPHDETSPADREHSAAEQPHHSEQAEHFAQRLGTSAQHIWLAGVGALGRMQSEGSKLFAALVREGEHIESRNREHLRDKRDHLREKVEAHVDDALDGARRQWDRVSRVFDSRLHAALRALNIPEHRDIQDLRNEIATLRSQVQQLQAAARTQPGHQDSVADVVSSHVAAMARQKSGDTE